MNRARLLLFVAYITITLVGGVVYAQSINNMISYTDADLKLWDSVNLVEIEIPRYVGENHDYVINITFRFDNLASTAIRIRTFDFYVAIDNGQPGSMFERGRLLQERIGTAGFSLGDLGSLLHPGEQYTQEFNILVKRNSPETFALNHTTVEGQYVAKIYDSQMSYGFPGSNLLRTIYPMPMVIGVDPNG